MKALIAYESMYGNTREVADAVAAGLSTRIDVTVASPEHISPAMMAGLDLLVVGGPTHMHGMTTEGSRQAAVETATKDPELDAEDDALGTGLREWLKALPMTRMYGAAFDTRIDKPILLTGSAAKGIDRRLRRRGCTPAIRAESFLVLESAGPLLEGELIRAEAWGVTLAERCGSGADA